MPRTHRCFVAVDLHVPKRVRSLVDELEGMRPAVRPAATEGLHVTVQFLGDVVPDDVVGIDRAVRAACEPMTRFDVDLVGVGAFPNERRPTVIWVGLRDTEPLVELAERLGPGLEALGYPPDDRRYTAHLTVARVKSQPPPELFELLGRHDETEFGRVTVDRVVLFQSDLCRSGPVYTPLSTHRLPKRRK